MPLNSRPAELPCTRRLMSGRRDYEKARLKRPRPKGSPSPRSASPGFDQAAGAGSGLPMSVPRLASASGRAR